MSFLWKYPFRGRLNPNKCLVKMSVYIGTYLCPWPTHWTHFTKLSRNSYFGSKYVHKKWFGKHFENQLLFWPNNPKLRYTFFTKNCCNNLYKIRVNIRTCVVFFNNFSKLFAPVVNFYLNLYFWPACTRNYFGKCCKINLILD